MRACVGVWSTAHGACCVRPTADALCRSGGQAGVAHWGHEWPLGWLCGGLRPQWRERRAASGHCCCGSQAALRQAAAEASGKAADDRAVAGRLTGRQWFTQPREGDAVDDGSAISEGSDAGVCVGGEGWVVEGGLSGGHGAAWGRLRWVEPAPPRPRAPEG